jgi:type I restriction enzyme M protein
LLNSYINEVAREQAQSFLREQDQQKILSAYESFSDQDGFAAVTPLGQIADKGYSLAIPLYVASASNPAADRIDIEAAVAKWRTDAKNADAAVDAVLTLLPQEAAQ